MLSKSKDVRKSLQHHWNKIIFESKEKKGIVPFKLVVVVTYYNGVNIKQNSHYIDIFNENYIYYLCELCGCKLKSKPIKKAVVASIY